MPSTWPPAAVSWLAPSSPPDPFTVRSLRFQGAVARGRYRAVTVSFEQALDSLNVGVVIATRDGETAVVNAAARPLLDGGPAEATLRFLIHEVVRTATERVEELDVHGPPVRRLRMRATPFAGGALVEIDDVTDARRLDQVRSDFVANVSHELKTPVAALELLAETLQGETDAEVVGRLSERVLQESHRLGRMIQDLLDLSRLEAGQHCARDAVDVEDVVKEALARVEATAGAKSVALDATAVTAGSMVGDRAQLVAMVANLLDNAVTYSDEGSVVEIGSAGTEAGYEVWVVDRGIGIPPHEIGRIFERFYRVDPARSRATGGTGLGLAIVRHVAQKHGAAIAVDSEPGRGSRFSITFPAPEEE